MTHGVSRGALLDLGTVEWVAARHLRSRELFREALSTVETAGDATLVALVNYRLGIGNVKLADMKEANESLRMALRTLDTEEGRRLFAFDGSRFPLLARCAHGRWLSSASSTKPRLSAKPVLTTHRVAAPQWPDLLLHGARSRDLRR